jgi:hypothetical protein
MLLFRSDLTEDWHAIADIDQVAELSLDKQIFRGANWFLSELTVDFKTGAFWRILWIDVRF